MVTVGNLMGTIGFLPLLLWYIRKTYRLLTGYEEDSDDPFLVWGLIVWCLITGLIVAGVLSYFTVPYWDTVIF